VGNATNANQHELGVDSGGSYPQLTTNLHTSSAESGDGGTGSSGAIRVEKVRGRESLAIGVVNQLVAVDRTSTDLGSVAKTTATAEDATVRKQNADGVVVARHGLSCEGFPGLGRCVEEFSLEDTSIIGEHQRAALSTSDEDGAIREHNSVCEATRVRHVRGTLNGSRLTVFANADQVGTVVGVRVGVIR
jgi:hypothetical protein